MQVKTLTFVEGSSSKFWSATQDGTTLTINYGRLGTAGQTQVKTFASETEAASAFSKQVAEKLKKGYVESGDAASPSQPPSAIPPPSPRPAGEPMQPLPNPSPKGKELSDSVPVTPATLDLTPPHQIKLTEADRKRAGVLALPTPEPRPEPKPFDREKCESRLALIDEGQNSWYSRKWERIPAPRTLTNEEAVFWILACQAQIHEDSMEKVMKKVKALTIPSTLTSLVASIGLNRLLIDHPVLALRCIFQIFGLTEIVHQLAGDNQHTRESKLLPALEKDILPHLSEEERNALREQLRARLTLTQQETWVLRLLAILGEAPSVLENLVMHWPQGCARPHYFGGYYGYEGNTYLKALLGLRSAEAIAREARRLAALPNGPEDIRFLLATTEFRCLELIREAIQQFTSKAEAESATKAFALAEAPEVAPYMLELLLDSKAPGVARQWLDEHPVFATEGLLPIATGLGKKADAALAYLRGLKKRELGYVIEAKLEGQPESIINFIRERVLEREEVVYEPLTESESPEWVKIVFGGELTVPDAPANENPERRLNLTEADKTIKALPPLPEYRPLPPAPPFDIDACLTKLLPLQSTYSWMLHKLEFLLPMSREEAHFWLEANQKTRNHSSSNPTTPQQLEGYLRGVAFGKDINKQRLLKHSGLLVPCFVLFGIEAIPDAIYQVSQAKEFAQKILPYLNDEQRGELRVLTHVTIKHQNNIGLLEMMTHLHSTQEDFTEVLGSLKEVQSSWWNNDFFPFILRLSEPEERIRVAEKIRVSPQKEKEARNWLAMTGWPGVNALENVLCRFTQVWLPGEKPGTMTSHQERVFSYDVYDKQEAVKMLALVEAPQMARHMVALRKYSSSKVIARGWLDRFPAFAIEGLAPLLVENDKKQIELAQDYLRELKRKGYGWLIAKKLAGFDDKTQVEVKKRVLDYDPRKDKAPIASDAGLAALLPPVLVKTESGLRRLTPQQQAMLVAELRTTPITEPSPSLELVKQNAEKFALDAFVWALFESWQSDGAPSKERWKLEALGHLGGDSVALKLTPLVRSWPGESQHQRAVLGLDCLRAIGTDTALMQINGIAEKISFKGIKERAKECMEAIAADRNFTRDELSDRIIPDGGLDARGSRVFDFGVRQFTFLLSAELKPMVRGEDGKRLPDLPKPNAKDDAEKAAEAIAAWKLLKKQVAEIAKSQAVRLEQAMVLGRRWTPEEFAQLFVAHPVMVHLVRRLIWCAYDETNAPLAAFRVGDDSTLADETDVLWELPKSATTVGIVHPAHLTTAQQGAWGEVLADYEIIPPFVQLGRPIYTLSDDEKIQPYLGKRFTGIKLDPKVLVFGLDGLGWTRGTPQDGGGFASHHKVFGSTIAVVTYEEGVWAGDNGDSWEPQEVNGIGFTSHKQDAEDGWFGWDYRTENLLPFTSIDPVIISEVLHDITRLVEKGRKS